MDLGKLAPWHWFRSESARTPAPAAGERPLSASPDPWRSFRALQQEMDRVFEQFFRGGMPAVFGGDSAVGFFAPALNIAEDDRSYRVELELPGLEAKDVNIELDDGVLVVRGEKKFEREERKERYHRIERSFGQFQRMLDLPEDADAEKITANFKNGVLTLTVPKRADRAGDRRRSIPVQAG